MKLKNSKKIDIKALITVWIVAVVLLVPLRFYQLLTIVDSEVGFYKNNNITIYIMYGLVAIFAIFFIVSAFLSSKAKSLNTDFKGNKPLGFFSICSAILLLYDSFITVGDFFEIVAEYGNNYGINNYTFFEYLAKSGGASRMFEIIFLLLSSIYFMLFGVCCFSSKLNVSGIRVLALSPSLWAISRMLTKLVRTISYIKISDLFYEIIMILFIMLFFMFFAQVVAKVNSEGIEWKVIAYGLFGSLMALVCNVPRLLMVLFGKADELCPDAPVELWDISLAIFILLFVINVYKKRIVEVEITDSTDKKEIE